MPNSIQYDTAKAQAESFVEHGYTVKFDMQPQAQDAAPAIMISKGFKVWKFSDPAWEIVIQQLAQLYKILIRSKRK